MDFIQCRVHGLQPGIGECRTCRSEGKLTHGTPQCPDCKSHNLDGHYDAVNQICPVYETAISEGYDFARTRNLGVMK